MIAGGESLGTRLLIIIILTMLRDSENGGRVHVDFVDTDHFCSHDVQCSIVLCKKRVGSPNHSEQMVMIVIVKRLSCISLQLFRVHDCTITRLC